MTWSPAGRIIPAATAIPSGQRPESLRKPLTACSSSNAVACRSSRITAAISAPRASCPSATRRVSTCARDDPERHPRWDHNLFIANRAGRIIDSWEQHNGLFVRTHKVKISPYDPDEHVWLIDDGANQITKFTNDGKEIVLQLGEFRVRGNDETHFARPTDMAWLPDGTFFISDGYVNTRVVKFDKDGNYLMTWGEKGTPPNETRPGYMNTVHSVAIDDNRRIYVADRANSRVQIFDENGTFLESWPGIVRPYYIYMSADQHLWVSDGRTQKFTKFDLSGNLLYSWGNVRRHAGWILGRAPIRCRQRRLSLHGRRSHRSPAEVHAEGGCEPSAPRRRARSGT